MGSEPVAIVGVGVCTPAGSSETMFWESLLAGTATTRQLDDDLFGRSPGPYVTTVPHVPYADKLEPHEVRRLDRPHLLAFSAFADAADGVDLGAVAANRVAVCVGTGYGAGISSEVQATALRKGGQRALSPLSIPLAMPNSVAGHLSIAYGITGPALTYCTACAAGATAIGEGMWLLRNRRADVAIAGGVDSLTFATPLAGFGKLGALSPSGVSRPFDEARDGFVMGEGAGFVALMRLTDAVADRRHIYGTLLGYGATSDAHHLVAPDPTGQRAAACIRSALADADVAASDISHVNAHGTATRLNDLAESNAVINVFDGSSPPVTAPKGVTGHMIGASGAVELVATVLSVRHRVVPPVGGLEHVDPDVRIDVVISEPRPIGDGPAISNSFAFGGHNVTLVAG